MNFYPHHIGDYLTATAHLSWLEDCAYRRLLDVYYSREQALPTDIAQACRLVRATGKDERKAVDTVLNEFFALGSTGWTHGRCDEEIIKAGEAAERARVNGKKGGRPSKQKPTANPEITQSVSVANPEISKSQAPITNPITNTNTSVDKSTATDGGKVDQELTKAELWTAGKSLLSAAGMPEKQCGSFVGKLVKDYGEQVVVEAVRSTVLTQPVDPAEYLKAVCQKSVGERASPESFRERDARAGRERWEEMTGEQHPDNAKQKPHSNILNVIDVSTVKRIGASA